MDKRELKRAYKQTPPPIGVYQIKNNINGKVMVGSSMNLAGSFNSYRFQLDFKSHHNKALREDLALYGPAAFTLEVLETIASEKIPKEAWREALSALEEKWLNNLQPYGDRGYNKQRQTKGDKG